MGKGVLLLIPGHTHTRTGLDQRDPNDQRRAQEPVSSPGQGAGAVWAGLGAAAAFFTLGKTLQVPAGGAAAAAKGGGIRETLTVLSTLLLHLVGPAGLRAGERAEPSTCCPRAVPSLGDPAGPSAPGPSQAAGPSASASPTLPLAPPGARSLCCPFPLTHGSTALPETPRDHPTHSGDPPGLRPHNRDPQPGPTGPQAPAPPPRSPLAPLSLSQAQRPLPGTPPAPLAAAAPSLVVARRHRAPSVLTLQDRKAAPHFRQRRATSGGRFPGRAA